MKIYSLIPALCVALYAGSASAQNWFEYDNREDLFTVNFPEQPTVTQQEYISEYDSPFPSNIYSASDGMTSYRVTVVDMENSARAPGRRGTEWRGSVDFEAAKLRRTGEVTFDAYAEINVVPGHQL
jgi:hypothetical protein